MRVYIAGPFEFREGAHRLMQLLERSGAEVTSTWITAPGQPDCEESARVDLQDLERADVVVMLNPSSWESRGTGGRHVEVGYALALKKTVVLCGPRSNVFHYLPEVVVVEGEALVPSALLKHALAQLARAEVQPAAVHAAS